MRPFAFLSLLLPMLAMPAAALASDFDIEELDQKLSLALQQQIDQTLLATLAAPIEPQQLRERGVPAGDPGPARMTCRASGAKTLECVVVARRPREGRIAQLP
jgi:hypothetical protein